MKPWHRALPNYRQPSLRGCQVLKTSPRSLFVLAVHLIDFLVLASRERCPSLVLYILLPMKLCAEAVNM